MNDFLDQIRALSPARLALLAVELKERLDASQQTAAEPIAIVGIGCRFPGADSPAEFWTLLREGRDEIREVPADRWPIDEYFDEDADAPGKISTRFGGFLDKIDAFDANFFGIAPREALVMDPQQRLLLEVSWEALEHAGIAPSSLTGTRTGVFVGICNTDYHQLLIARGGDALDAYVAQGNAHSVAAGRLSYVLGLQGPSLSIDTSCSASLVAIHTACQSIRSGESTLALAGGVNIICAPDTSVALSKGHMLAPDGRCKTFDAAGDGFSRGEGCGIVVLKRLSDARRDGDTILALIRGSAVNQDGRSGGLTVPNGPAQEAVIRDALSAAGVAPPEIDYVEAHGTGTSLGDPIEVRALGRALGAGRATDRPLLIGSVKTNFGHLESAAGVAGLIKIVLAMQHEELPRHLNFSTPNPHIEWKSLPVSVVSERRPWPRNGRARRAGVSSFGFSGTNAHLILEEAPAVERGGAANDRPLHLMPVSARTDGALRELATSHANVLASEGAPSLADAAYTAGVGRSQFVERMAVVAADAGAARAALGDFVAGRPNPAVRRASVATDAETDVVFLFTGAGAQYPGMGQALYDASPVYRDAIDRCDTILGADANGLRLKAVLAAGPAEGAAVHRIAWTQPALFAVEYALTELWRSWGIRPAAAIGHSTGEYVAACVAGVFSLEDGLRLVAERGRLMESLPTGGAMAALYAPADEVAAAIAGMPGRVAIAAINAPDNVVVSGDAAVVDDVLAYFSKRNVEGQRLFVSVAAHSPLMDPALDAMEAYARSVTMSPPKIPVASNLTGKLLSLDQAPDATYWRDHMRAPVRFADGVQTLYGGGYRIFLEVGPHPTLLALAQRSLPERGSLSLNSLRRGKDDWVELFTSLADLYTHGAAVDWAGVDRPYGRRRVDLPTYPFERDRYWAPATPHYGVRESARASVLDDRLFYRVDWQPVHASAPSAGSPRTWLLLADRSPLARKLGDSLTSLGDRVTIVARDEWVDTVDSPVTLSHAAWWAGAGDSVLDIVYLGGLDSGEGADAAPELSSSVALTFLQAASHLSHARVWMVTRGAQDADGAQDVIAPDQASIWGLGRTFALEHPLSWGGLIDLDPRESVSDGAGALVAAMRASDGEDQVAWRRGRRVAARIVRASPPVPATLALDPDASYLITGGLGGLGLAVAKRLVDRGARHLVLLGRTRVPPREHWKERTSDRRIAAIVTLERAGAIVETEAIDVGDQTSMQDMMATFGRERPSLRGVVHAAVAPTASPLADMSQEMMSAMFRTKVEGARLLAELSLDQPIEFFVTFSTTTALLGLTQLAHYAASNAVLDGFASCRASAGMPALSVNWGTWDQLNIDEVDRARVARGGLLPMPTSVGLDALEALIAAGHTRAMVAHVDWPILRSVYESRRAQRILSQIEQIRTLAPATTPASQREPSRQAGIDFELLEPGERRSTIERTVRAAVADVLGIASPAQFDSTRNLFESGMDSLMSVSLKSRLERELRASLPPTLTFNYPTVDALVGFLDHAVSQRTSDAASVRERALLDRVPEMSDGEVDALLAQMLNQEPTA